ncbi:hypothetical protein B0H10DRAFT_2024635 [Mycena sp. CBHHK59/15]|nr:hypothetical protein B0H10DRAFT_2024635 [Mycena sp. CBHHK59/15]
MSPPLLSLPADILISILAISSPEDILSVSQTCRVLHAFTSNDYIWHQLPDDLPLDIEPYVDRNNLSGSQLKAIFTRALRVEHNWRKPVSRIQRMARFMDIDTVSQMQFLGSNWLVTLRRSPLGASLSIWRIADTKKVYRAALVDVPTPAVPLKLTASMQKGCSEVLIAITASKGSGTLLRVYSVGLKSQMDDGVVMPPPRAIFNIYRPESEGRFHEVHVCGHIITVGIPKFINHVLRSAEYRILCINSHTGVQCLVDPHLPDQFAQVHFRLYNQCLVIAGVRSQSTLVIRIYDLPPVLVSTSPWETSPCGPVEALVTPNAEYETHTITGLDYDLSADSTYHNISHISSISFHPLVGKGDDYVFRFPLDSSPRKDFDKRPSFFYPFTTHSSASAEIVCLGETGHRAVWLERRWTSDEYTLMKATFSPNKPVVVAPLLARNLALPFELHTCQSLAFDESTGRVCLALHTGELYILEF